MEQKIYSPLSGRVVYLENVKDEVFSKKIMGGGLALESSNKRVVAPFDGEVTVLFPTLHAIGLTSNEGVELLIHIGINTYELNGEGFNAKVEVGSKVNCGDLLMDVDFNLIKGKGYDSTVMVVCTNSEVDDITENDSVNEKELIFQAKKVGG